ncbi:MAG TPA: nucleotide sugar dehydrogenase [Acidobacteriota bacterium]
MNIVLFGAGYVGSVTAACLVRLGHAVLVVDPADFKVEAIRAGLSPVAEPGLKQLIAEGVRSGRLRAAAAAGPDCRLADVAMVCVGTPSGASGRVETGALERVLDDIADSARGRSGALPVAIRSTVLAPVLRDLIARLPPEPRLRCVANPEFLRETSAIADFHRPPFIVAGGDDPAALETVLELYRGLEAPRHRLDLESAILVKYACNAYHALKIAFANEIATLAELGGGDAGRVMEVVAQDRLLNLAPAYLRPGFAFGGSCLPKDLRALSAWGRLHHEPLPLLAGVQASNQRRIEQAIERILAAPGRILAVIGLSFKPQSDDLRESPYVELVERLLGKGYEIRIFDPDVDPATMVGSNLAYIHVHLPHLARLLVATPEQALRGAQGLVLCKPLVPHETLAALVAPGLTVHDIEGHWSRGQRAAAGLGPGASAPRSRGTGQA